MNQLLLTLEVWMAGGGQDTVSWHLNDPNEEEQGTHSEIIGDGQDASWNYDQYNVMEGIWILSVVIDQGDRQY